jgi:hypothetical protein
MVSAGLSSRDFARRHAKLSRELLDNPDLGRTAPSIGAHNSTALPPQSSLRSARGAAFALCLLAGIAALVEIGPVPKQARGEGAAIDLCAFVPTFSEEFDTLSVSPWGENGSRWIAHTPWHGDFGDAAFADPRPGFPFRVRAGILEIEARKDADGKWQSGLLASAAPSTVGFSQRYGYFETRAQLPPGPGTWPAFWLGTNQPEGSKEPGVEIDVFEYYGQFPNAYHSAIHVWEKVDPTKSRAEDHITDVSPGSLTNAFHTHGVDVEPDWITFYLDRRETWRVATPPELQEPLLVLVNLALGSGWPIDETPNPSIMKVDYVHAYRPRATDEPRSCTSAGEGTSLPAIRRHGVQ